MAQSYANPDKPCYGPSANPDNPTGWKNFCDCMFLGARTRVTVTVDGKSLYIPGTDDETLIEEAFNTHIATAVASQLKATPNAKIVYTESLVPKHTENWYRCTSLLCAIPGAGDNYGKDSNVIDDAIYSIENAVGLKITGGCVNSVTTAVDPFNIAPGMLFAPWTDVGAAARGIPKQDAGFGYTFQQIFSIDLNEYKPLALWQSFFLNPGKFEYLALKVAFLFPPAGILMSGLLTTPLFGIATLGPLAAAQCLAERKDVGTEMMLPAMRGSISYAMVALKSLGSFLGGQWFSLAGAILGKVAQDQVNTGEINKVGDAFTRGIIVFLAQYAAQLGDEMQNAVNGGLDLQKAPRVVKFIADMFKDLSKNEAFDAPTKEGFLLTSKVLETASIIAQGVQDKAPTFDTIDKIVDALFGFKLTQLQDALKEGQTAVKTLLDRAQSIPGKTPPDVAMQLFDLLQKTFNDFSEVIKNITGAVDGSMKQLTDQFDAAAAAFAPIAAQAQTTIAQAITTSGGKLPPVGAAAPPLSTLQNITIANPKINAPAVLGGAGVGYLVGGPVGAGVGALAAFFFTNQKLSFVAKSAQAIKLAPENMAADTGVIKAQPAMVPTSVAALLSAKGAAHVSVAGFGGFGAGAAGIKGLLRSAPEKTGGQLVEALHLPATKTTPEMLLKLPSAIRIPDAQRAAPVSPSNPILASTVPASVPRPDLTKFISIAPPKPQPASFTPPQKLTEVPYVPPAPAPAPAPTSIAEAVANHAANIFNRPSLTWNQSLAMKSPAAPAPIDTSQAKTDTQVFKPAPGALPPPGPSQADVDAAGSSSGGGGASAAQPDATPAPPAPADASAGSASSTPPSGLLLGLLLAGSAYAVWRSRK